MNKHLNIQSATLLGVLANFSFLLFIFFGACYYIVMSHTGSGAIEVAGEYGVMPFEVIGFVLLAAFSVGYFVLLRDMPVFKCLVIVYFLVELILMLCDFEIIFGSVYNRKSPVLIIAHIVFSMVVMFFFTKLDEGFDSLRIACLTAMGITMLLPIPLWFIFSFQMYFSILSNSVAFLWLLGFIYLKLNSDEMYIDAVAFDEKTGFSFLNHKKEDKQNKEEEE